MSKKTPILNLIYKNHLYFYTWKIDTGYSTHIYKTETESGHRQKTEGPRHWLTVLPVASYYRNLAHTVWAEHGKGAARWEATRPCQEPGSGARPPGFLRVSNDCLCVTLGNLFDPDGPQFRNLKDGVTILRALGSTQARAWVSVTR